MIEFQQPYRGFKTSDGRVFTAQAVLSSIDRDKVTVCATHDDAKLFAEAHEQSLGAQ